MSISMDVTSVVTPIMGLAAVGQSLDPRHVITTIDVNKAEPSCVDLAFIIAGNT